MQILRAPNDNTVTRVTSVGEVKFVNGIATDFTPEQAQFFTQRQRGYVVDDIVTEEETAEAKVAAEQKILDKQAAEQKVLDEEEAQRKVAEEEKAAAERKVLDEQAAEKKAAEEEEAARIRAIAISEFLLVSDDASFGDVRAFAKEIGINAGGNKQAIIDRMVEASGKSPADSDEEPAAEITEVEEMVDLAEADHAALVEVAEQYNIDVEEAWSTEELRAALLADEEIQEAMAEVEATEDEGEETPPDGEDETSSTDETTEAAQNAPDGPQSAPAATSVDQGTGGPPETRRVKLPTGRDSLALIAQWCREHQVDHQGTKADLLERIYADERFKQ